MQGRLILLFMCCLLFSCGEQKPVKFSLTGQDWFLLLDTLATWRTDTIYPPGLVDWANIPVNKPTGGWQVLNEKEALVLTLPASVERSVCDGDTTSVCLLVERFDPFTETYFSQRFYSGVSWWWTALALPEHFVYDSLRLCMQVLAARTEVYIDTFLLAYHCCSGTFFCSDVSSYLRPGEMHRLHIRITSDALHDDFLSAPLLWGETQQPIPFYQGGAGLGSRIWIEGWNR